MPISAMPINAYMRNVLFMSVTPLHWMAEGIRKTGRSIPQSVLRRLRKIALTGVQNIAFSLLPGE
jgi:hypothetical protein